MNVSSSTGKLLVVGPASSPRGAFSSSKDLILPISWIEERMDDVVGLAHPRPRGPHRGAVPYLLKLRGDIPDLRIRT